MKSLIRRLSLAKTVWLLVVWVLVFGNFEPLTVLSGLLLAMLIQMFLPLPHTDTRWRINFFAAVRLGAVFLRDLFVSTWHVSGIVLSGRVVKNEVIIVPMMSSDPVHMTIMSALTSLIPGSLVVKIDREESALHLHVLDVDHLGGQQQIQSNVHRLEKRLLEAIAGTPILPRPNPRLVNGGTR